MKIAIVQFDSRPPDALGFLAPLILRNSHYAEQHGYEHFFVSRLGMDIPPFWAKPHVVMFYLKSGYDIVLWLDTDAVVHDLAMPVTRFFVGDEVFIYASDNPVWRSPFNAGVFICKGIVALDLMLEWAALYQPDQWEKHENDWRCRDARWAGPAYEQGSFAIKILPKYGQSGLFKQLPWEVLQSPFPVDNSFTLHFAERFKANIRVYCAAFPVARPAGEE
ncbi:MAG: hypothetical protein DI595_15135 [Agrobacterium fabrum]|uniref:Nucleotide-diphospho-sugar transferase domain-containing protein n=1 Tax=Agrobacterium fabrum TaxID=1176649 RepID=A0A2W5GZB0_9HYPH|nr:MAG: hypothetical protein DI595_15135 [Agrobacterium fabrum]